MRLGDDDIDTTGYGGADGDAGDDGAADDGAR